MWFHSNITFSFKQKKIISTFTHKNHRSESKKNKTLRFKKPPRKQTKNFQIFTNFKQLASCCLMYLIKTHSTASLLSSFQLFQNGDSLTLLKTLSFYLCRFGFISWLANQKWYNSVCALCSGDPGAEGADELGLLQVSGERDQQSHRQNSLRPPHTRTLGIVRLSQTPHCQETC